jgi:hypothetical protein
MSDTLKLPRLFALKELTHELKVSSYLLRSDIRSGRLPAIRVGQRIFISEDAIRKYLAVPYDVPITQEGE